MSDHRDDLPPDMSPDELAAVAEIEVLLGELDLDDLDPVAPPAEVWAGIERQLAAPAPPTVIALPRRDRRFATWAAAAAAVVVLGVGAIALATRGGDETEIVSTAALTFDPASFDPRGADASGKAQLVERDGTYEIRLADTRFPRLDGDDLELWLIKPDANGNPVEVAPVSLVDPDGDGRYDVPAGLDPNTHYVVDISIEPRDGDPTHSGRSILRGPLQAQ